MADNSIETQEHNRNRIMWQPSAEQIATSNMTQFMAQVESNLGVEFADYSDFYKWSVENSTEFWTQVLDISNVDYNGEPIPAKGSYPLEKIPRPEWFPNINLNYAENLLRKRGDTNAIISVCEGRDKLTVSWDGLRERVRVFAAYLVQNGVGKGDRVAGFVLNTHETIIAMLAAASLGATWSSCSPDFGFEGVLDRFGQIEPKIFVAVNGYYYSGRKFDTRERIVQIAKSVKSIEKMVVIDVTGDAMPENTQPTVNYEMWDEITEDTLDDPNRKLSFIRLPFDHPLFIMFSSGTTGKPKCIVHGAGGTLLQHWKEHHLHTNVSEGTVITYFTTCGWMMWNWLVGALSAQATLFLFDGSPASPTMSRLWDEVDSNNVEIFGTSPKFLSASEKADVIPKDEFELANLKCILSTGSPLTDVNFDYVYGSVKRDVRLSSISGGTDIVSCFMLGNPVLPVLKGEIQCRGLGMGVLAYDEDGNSVIGAKGELVCEGAFPSMPIYFWDDESGDRYFDAYFAEYDRVWKHGDFVEITTDGGVIVYGRSDATLNPGGIRIGTAEIYRVVEAMDEVVDSVCVGLPTDDGDVEVVLFVVMKSGYHLDTDLEKQIRVNVRKGATPRHVPARVHAVDAIPVTISGKKVEIAVANRLKGIANKNLSALANPEALEGFDKYK